jgi:hypothetical protein
MRGVGAFYLDGVLVYLEKGNVMQVLTLREVVIACHIALRDKTLLGEVGGDAKYISENGCKCAIGIAMSNETLQQIVDNDYNKLSVTQLEETGVVKFGEWERNAVAELQARHDCWAECEGERTGVEAGEVREAFRREVEWLYRRLVIVSVPTQFTDSDWCILE